MNVETLVPMVLIGFALLAAVMFWVGYWGTLGVVRALREKAQETLDQEVR